MSESSDMQLVQEEIAKRVVDDLGACIIDTEKRMRQQLDRILQYGERHETDVRMIVTLKNENERLKRENVDLRNCMNCVRSPFRGIRCNHHCGEWLANRCSDNPKLAVYLAKWEKGGSK